MCILALAWQAHPRWQLVVAANRDEYHDRAAAPLARWGERDVIAGRDLQAGGTWLGVSEGGRFAAVTNLRGFDALDPAPASRGSLVADLVAGNGPYADLDLEKLTLFNPFNAIAISPEGALHLSNRPHAIRQALSPGLHGMSNGPLDPPWHKTARLTRQIEHWLDDPAATAERLLIALRDPEQPNGKPGDTSTIFVKDAVYGTRCSTVVMIDHAGVGSIIERRYDPAGQPVGDVMIPFHWDTRPA
ncbi:NRDE family protein [Sphingobium aromaticiconvertens]|uniref:NRDE family protein n=1 Tax=Sphingobium aromaticiconvertens TaxID=365341 RepID=UPI0030192E8C